MERVRVLAAHLAAAPPGAPPLLLHAGLPAVVAACFGLLVPLATALGGCKKRGRASCRWGETRETQDSEEKRERKPLNGAFGADGRGQGSTEGSGVGRQGTRAQAAAYEGFQHAQTMANFPMAVHDAFSTDDLLTEDERRLRHSVRHFMVS